MNERGKSDSSVVPAKLPNKAPVVGVIRMGAARNRRFFDIEGAADHLSGSVRFVWTLVAERRVPSFKVGKFVRFVVEDLDNWLDDCRVEVG